ncbi:hypothetical protein D9M70_489970 [compost metagenome]
MPKIHITDTKLNEIITRDLGAEACIQYLDYQIPALTAFISAITHAFVLVPPTIDSSVLITAGLATALRAQRAPAVLILGDLIIDGQHVNRP